ncbi:uncharacterized protein LOC124273839 [Haliotis rubra]|uniref:uncharacterized protein LOC124273839 n=1 Tax=Haliotis rubra TaxID=36100 RepID=UPI001EE4EE83|nr:uncharacterized protein LOC124273839 [Haliotis rubra]
MELMKLWITLNSSSTSEEMVSILNSLVRLNVCHRRILESLSRFIKLDPEQRRQASEYLLMFKMALITETNIWKEVMSQPHGSMMAGTVVELQHTWDTPLVNKQSSKMCQALESLLGQNGFRMNWTPKSSAFMLDIVVYVKDGRPVEVQEEEVDCDKRLVLLIRRPEHYRIRHNSQPRLLGKYVMMKRHLLRSGYSVLEVSGEAVDSNKDLMEYFQRLLQPYIAFSEE